MARAIDIQPIIEEINSSLDIASYSEHDRGFDDGLKYVLDLIEKTPPSPAERAADVVPVRHGRWIHPHWRNSVSAADCSECGAEAHHIEYRGVQKYYKICPSCGARMDKEN